MHHTSNLVSWEDKRLALYVRLSPRKGVTDTRPTMYSGPTNNTPGDILNRQDGSGSYLSNFVSQLYYIHDLQTKGITMHKNQATATDKYRKAHNIKGFTAHTDGALIAEIREFLKTINRSNIDLVIAGYNALKERHKE